MIFGHKKWINRPVFESYKCDLLDDAAEINEHRAPWGNTSVVVDLSMPDALLIEQFREWLSDTRKLMPASAGHARFQRPDFDAWTKYGVLPFLDLTIWARENGKSIPYRVMADAIFPPGEGDSEWVRKTVAPLAMALVSESDDCSSSVMSILAAQAKTTNE